MKGEIDNEITLKDRDSIWQEDTADHVTGSPTKNSRLAVEVATERIKASRSAYKQRLPALSRDTRETRSGTGVGSGTGAGDFVEPRRHGCECPLMIAPCGDWLVKRKKMQKCTLASTQHSKQALE